MQSPYTSFILGPPHSDRACLLIHGFNGSPSEMLSLGRSLAAQGIHVHGISLAGHTGDPEALLHSNRKLWLQSAEEGLSYLQSFPHVFVGGLSMGGVLALLLALKYPHRIAGVITLSTPTRFTGGWYIHALPVARHFVKWFYPLEHMDFNKPQIQDIVLQQARLRDPDVSIDFSNPQVVTAMKQLVRIPVPAIAELFTLTNQCRRQLHRLRLPLLIIHSHHDLTVPPACANELHNLTRAAFPKFMYWLDRSDHVVTLGPEQKLIATYTLEFIKQITPDPLVLSQPALARLDSSGERCLDD